MDTVRDIAPSGRWPRDQERDVITLAYEARHRRRLRMRADGGWEFLLDLPEAVLLREGDGLRLSGGGFVRVAAAKEELLEVTTASAHELARLAWHIGNRHLAAEIAAERILLRRDHVIAEMLAGLGACVREVTASFNPESGAYHWP
jgi:urease accessory protein